jgi:hypothetical protein
MSSLLHLIDRCQHRFAQGLQALPPAARTPVPVGLAAVALAGGLLLSFQHVVAGAVERAQSQQQVLQQHDEAEAPCRALRDRARRALCEARVEAQMLDLDED